MFKGISNDTNRHSGSRLQAHQAEMRYETHPSLHAGAEASGGLAQFQKTYGNQAVLRTLSHSAPTAQTKLEVNQPGDEYEQEADLVADQVMRMAAPPAVQRRCSACEREEQLHRKCAHCEEDEQKDQLHRKENGAGPAVAPPSVHEVLHSPGEPLDTTSRAFFEPRFGHDFSRVRIHRDAKAADSAQAVGALAYTVGNHIAFAGRPEPRLMAHELVHVVQQGAGSHRADSSQAASDVSMALPPALQRQTSPQFVPGVAHNHQPSGRWDYIRWHANSGFLIGLACFFHSPRGVAESAIEHQFSDKPTALRHLEWYLEAGGVDFYENDNLDRMVRTSEGFRRRFMVKRQGAIEMGRISNPNRGFMTINQGDYDNEDFRFSWGTIDRMDFEIDDAAGTIRLWFKDRYEFHPYYPSVYRVYGPVTGLPDDETGDVWRETNCVHAAMVELKNEGAADFWMIGQATFPMTMFAFSPQDIMREEGAESMRSAGNFIDALRQLLQADRVRARLAAANAGGIAAGSRAAHPILNQTVVRRYLERARRIYDARRPTVDRNHPVQGRFREVYARFLTEVREAFDEALALSGNDQQAEREEQSAYGESLLLWLEASPLHDTALSGRTSFTADDVAASQRQETDLSTVLTTIVPYLNLVQTGVPDRARAAINATRNRITSVGGAPATRTTATGASQTAADAAIDQINQAQRVIQRGQTILRAATSRLDVWLQAPTSPVDVADRVNDLFNTRDPGYGRLLRDRLQVMEDNLEGHGRLFAHMLLPGDTSNCTSTSTLGQRPRAYEFVFCRFHAALDPDAATLLHELAHAVIPGRGSRGSAESGFPEDRAYAGERLLGRMTTEEALNNAESYAELAFVLAGLPVQHIPTDTVTGCADNAPLLDGLALAQSAHRRAWDYLEEARSSLRAGNAIQPWLRTLIDTHLGTPSDAELMAMLNDFEILQTEATIWSIGHTFSCAPASACPANAVAFDDHRIYRNGSVVARSQPAVRNPRLCPAFFALNADDRARAAHVLVSLSFGATLLSHRERAWNYASLALAIYHRDFGAPPASSLAEHTAADAPQSPATIP